MKLNIALILQIIQAAMQLAPLTLETIAGVKALLAKDPSVPQELKDILNQTIGTNDTTLAQFQIWLLANPEAK